MEDIIHWPSLVWDGEVGMDDNILVAVLARETEGVRTIAVADWLERGEGV